MRRPALLVILLLVFVLVFGSLLLVTGMATIRFQTHSNQVLAAGSPSSITPCVGAAAPAQWKHVVVLMFENKTYDQVIGSASAPYITNLASKCGVASPHTSAKNGWHDSNYKVDGTTDGNYVSKPSYATLTNGVPPSVHGIIDDTYATTTTVDNIYNQLNQAGKTFKDYYDAGAGGCGVRFSGDYHDAIRYYTNVASICNAHDAPLSTFMTDVNAGNLPAFSMILPTNDENMHNNTIASGDTWAQNFLNPLLDSAQYKSGDTAIFFLYDEDTPIPDVLIAPSIVSGSSVPVLTGNPISHFSGLRTFEEMLGLPLLGNVAQAPSLLSFFNGSGGTPPPSDTIPPTAPTNLVATATSSTQVNLSWTASTDNVGVTGYKVYRNSTLVGTPATNSFSDTGLSPSTTYSYYVVANDAAGNSSPNSAIVSATTQAPPCPTMPTDKGTATLTVNITTAGTYKIWSRIMGTGDTGNSYYLQVDSNCGVNVGDLVGMAPNTWTWVDYQDGSANTKTTVTLTVGSHILKLIGREVGLKLDRLVLTTDTTCVPTGTGDSCASTTKLGDINGDGVVNSADLAILLSTWGSTTDRRADVNADGKVNSADLAILLSRWGS